MASSTQNTYKRQDHYYPDVFNGKKNSAFAATALVGITLLVIGVLAKIGMIHGISSSGSNALMGLGGGILGVELLSVLYFARKHFSIKSDLKRYILANPEWTRDIFDDTFITTDEKHKFYSHFSDHNTNSYSVYMTFQKETIETKQGPFYLKQCHLFLNEKQFDAYKKLLADTGFSHQPFVPST